MTTLPTTTLRRPTTLHLTTRRMSTTKPTTPFITAFYDPAIRRQDPEGRTLDSILQFSDSQLEHHHDYIQYLFPLPERSPVNPRAPVITRDVREAFLAREDLRRELQRSLDRILAFYGFSPLAPTTNNDEGKTTTTINPSPNFTSASKNTWRKRFDHNHLRITRIIRSLRVLGLEDAAKAFHTALVVNDDPPRVSSRSRLFWERAASRPLRLAPQEEDATAAGVGWLREG